MKLWLCHPHPVVRPLSCVAGLLGSPHPSAFHTRTTMCTHPPNFCLHLNLHLDLQRHAAKTTALNIPWAGSRFTISKISHTALIPVIG